MTALYPSLESKALAILESLIAAFPMDYRPKLVWRKLRVTAGSADYVAKTITLSTALLIDEERLELTLKHEYAHLLAVARHGRRAAGHGEHWKQAMLDLGQDPKRTHNYPVERNRTHQEVFYRCMRCGAVLVRKRRLPRRRLFVHAKCGGPLRLEACRQTADEPGSSQVE